MKRLGLLFLVLAAPAQAGERSYFVSDFDRVRIEGPFDVHLATRGTPAARAVWPGAQSDAVEVRVEGKTLIVRAKPRDGDSPRADANIPILYLRTTDLRAASVVGGGKLEVTGPMRGARIDLQISGSGSLLVAALDADQLGVVMLGTGAMVLGGRAAQARMLASGAGAIAAAALKTDDLVLHLDGSGDVTASARYFATVTATGLGTATVYGTPKCTIGHGSSGPVRCGVPAPAEKAP